MKYDETAYMVNEEIYQYMFRFVNYYLLLKDDTLSFFRICLLRSIGGASQCFIQREARDIDFALPEFTFLVFETTNLLFRKSFSLFRKKKLR